MNSIPDRGKECLPPKKRESRQGSSEQPPAVDFKPPAPLRTRPVGRQAGGEGPSSNLHYSKDLHLPPPPTPSAPKFALPWPLHNTGTIPYQFLTNQAGDGCSSKAPVWRDSCSRAADYIVPGFHQSRWQRGELSPMPPHLMGATPYKAFFPLDPRDMRAYYNVEKLEQKHQFSRPAAFPDPHLDGRRSYTVKKPNGLDGMECRNESMVRLPSGVNYVYDSKAKPDSTHTNGKKRFQGDQRSLPGMLAKDHIPGREAHSLPQIQDPSVALKASTANTSDKRNFKVPSDTFGLADAPREAHIYYSLGSTYPGFLQPPQAHPLLNDLDQALAPPLFGPSTEKPHTLRNSQLSPLLENRALEAPPLAQYNNHCPARGRSPGDPPSSTQSCTSVRGHRLQTTLAPMRSGAPSEPPSAAQPPMLLPHFTKGSLIQLSDGDLRRVEELRTEDFLLCANTSPEFHLSSFTVLRISPCSTPGFSNLEVLLADRNTQESLKVLVEYPFFVCNRGWSSCWPQRTAQLYALHCCQLSEGDVCLALTPVPTAMPPASASHADVTGGEEGRLAPRVRSSEMGLEAGARRPGKKALPAPVPLPPPTGQSWEPAQARKRHHSAPELLGEDGTSPDLPCVSKHGKRQ